MTTPEMYVCLGGLEISRGPRVFDYIRNSTECLAGGVFTLDSNCECETIDTGPFNTPATDPAPWFEASLPESAEFLGFLASLITVQPVASRVVRPSSRGGGVVGPLSLRPRIIEFVGYLFAESYQGMSYGERWLTQALTGAYCRNGCAADELEILPSCPDQDAARFFRTLAGVGLVDGPFTLPVGDLPETEVQEVRFTMTAGSPWLIAPAVDVIAEGPVAGAGSACGLVSTISWPGDKTLTILIEAPESGDVTDVVIEVNGSPSGACPDTSTEPYVRYELPLLEAGHSITVDGPAREVSTYDATRKLNVAGMGLLDFEGLFSWPDVPPESDVCVCVTNNGATALTLTVTEHGREI